MILLLGAAAAAVLWSLALAAPWRPWSTRERLESDPALAGERLDDVTVLIPARNEADTIAATLRSLAGQGPGLRIVVVDDRSGDDTAGAVLGAGVAGVELVAGRDLPHGWTGKVWAQSQGRTRLDRTYTLLLDADIVLAPALVATLRREAERRGVALLSLMAALPTGTAAERLLVPAFVFFFKLLYPFRLSNDPRRRTAAAAGGCVLLRTAALDRIGGFESLRDAIIDDCRLAALVKQAGLATWVGLTRSVRSQRRYRRVADVWDMVARTAYTQLRYSPWLLLACTATMSIAFVAPWAAAAAGDAPARIAGVLAVAAMSAAYLPTLRFYRVSPAWAPALAGAGVLFLAMTLGSALRYHRGVRSAWRGRRYRRG